MKDIRKRISMLCMIFTFFDACVWVPLVSVKVCACHSHCPFFYREFKFLFRLEGQITSISPVLKDSVVVATEISLETLCKQDLFTVQGRCS